MDKKTFYGTFYILLLTMTVPALCAKMDKQVNEDKRQIQVAALPLYAGLAVSPWVWAALIAAYGAAKLAEYAITKGSSDSHSCANNRGWCRAVCHSNEVTNHYFSDVCGNYYCCIDQDVAIGK